MSDYDDLKRELRRLNKEISGKHHKLKQISDELETIDKEKDAAKSLFNENKSVDYNTKYKAHLDKIVTPIELEMQSTQQEMEKEDEEFKSEFDSMTAEKFMEQCTDTQELLDQVQKMSSELREQLQQLLGSHLYTNVCENLSSDKMNLDVSDLDRVISYFNECEEKVNSMLERPDYIGDAIMKTEDSLTSFEVGTIKSKGAAAFLVVLLLVIFVLLWKFVFPVYVIFICVIALFHIFRTYSVYEILLVQKGIADNINTIREMLQQQAEEEAQRSRAELQSEHQERMKYLQSHLQELLHKKESAIDAAQSSFFYDGTAPQKALDSKLVNLEKREADLISSRMIFQKELNELTEALAEIKQKMDSVFSKQQNDYLNYENAGESFILDRKFLIDIDDITQKLVFLNFPEESALFIYKDREEVINLIKLLNVQIRSKLHPLAYEVVYYDTMNVGQDCYFFVPEIKDKNDPAGRLFRIISNDEEFQSVLSSYMSEMKARQKNFRHDGTIDQYNKHMMEIDSLAVPYHFAFVLDPDASVVKKMGAITRAAGTYGIYICTFVSEQSFIEMKQAAKEIVDLHSVFFAVQSGKVNSRAKDFIIDNYCDKREL